MNPLAWIRVIGEALGLVERAVDVGEKIAGKSGANWTGRRCRGERIASGYVAANARQIVIRCVLSTI